MRFNRLVLNATLIGSLFFYCNVVYAYKGGRDEIRSIEILKPDVFPDIVIRQTGYIDTIDNSGGGGFVGSSAFTEKGFSLTASIAGHAAVAAAVMSNNKSASSNSTTTSNSTTASKNSTAASNSSSNSSSSDLVVYDINDLLMDSKSNNKIPSNTSSSSSAGSPSQSQSGKSTNSDSGVPASKQEKGEDSDGNRKELPSKGCGYMSNDRWIETSCKSTEAPEFPALPNQPEKKPGNPKYRCSLEEMVKKCGAGNVASVSGSAFGFSGSGIFHACRNSNGKGGFTYSNVCRFERIEDDKQESNNGLEKQNASDKADNITNNNTTNSNKTNNETNVNNNTVNNGGNSNNAVNNNISANDGKSEGKGEKGDQIGEYCKHNADTLLCNKIGKLSDKDLGDGGEDGGMGDFFKDLREKGKKKLEFKVQNIINSDAICPAPIELSFFDVHITIKYDLVCDFLRSIRLFVIGLFALMTAKFVIKNIR